MAAAVTIVATATAAMTAAEGNCGKPASVAAATAVVAAAAMVTEGKKTLVKKKGLMIFFVQKILLQTCN